MVTTITAADVNRKRYQYKIGQIQYHRDFSDSNITSLNTTTEVMPDVKSVNSKTQTTLTKSSESASNKFSVIEQHLGEIKTEISDIKEKLTYLTEKFEFYEDDEIPLSSGNNSEENGMVIYGADESPFQSGDEYWEQKKGLFGTKMVKKTVK